jgi:hypothetical protein
MPIHKFKLGQSVQFAPDKLQAAPTSGVYEITRLLPSAGRDLQYRIKNALEPYERMAQESQLTPD